MSFDPTWEAIHRSRSWGRYPPEELVRFVARRFGSPVGRTALDLGCGGGANTWLLAREGFAVTGVDGSAAAIAHARELLDREGLNADLRVADLASLDLPADSFDCVIDVSSIQHNGTAAAARIVELVHRALRPGGSFFSMLVGTATTGSDAGAPAGDGSYTRVDAGPLQGTGRTRFYSRADVERLMEAFRSVSIDRSERTDLGSEYRIEHWVATGVK